MGAGNRLVNLHLPRPLRLLDAPVYHQLGSNRSSVASSKLLSTPATSSIIAGSCCSHMSVLPRCPKGMPCEEPPVLRPVLLEDAFSCLRRCHGGSSTVKGGGSAISSSWHRYSPTMFWQGLLLRAFESMCHSSARPFGARPLCHAFRVGIPTT